MFPLTGELIFSVFKSIFMHKVFINIALFLISFFLLSANADAQISKPGITIGGHLIYAKPKGDFANAYKFGGGGEVFGGIGLGKTFIIATAGLSKFAAHSDTHSGWLTYTPLKIGLKHYLFRKLLFVNADIGKAIVKNKNFNESRFTRGIGVGAKLLGLEAGLYYDGWKNVNAGGFANSVNFKLGWSILL